LIKLKISSSLALSWGRIKTKTILFDPAIFEVGFTDHCNLTKCNAGCCRLGVYIDQYEVNRIMRYKNKIAGLLESKYKDPSTWFVEEKYDKDAPSTKVYATRADNQGCIFLLPDNSCVLQTYATKRGYHKWYLKPLNSIMFPLVVQDGVLTIEPVFKNKLYCQNTKCQTKTLFEGCKEEIVFLIGNKNYSFLSDNASGM